MVTIKLYVEGGGDSKALKTACRKGFRKFIEKAGLMGNMPKIVACGGRQKAYQSFRKALIAGGFRGPCDGVWALAAPEEQRRLGSPQFCY